MKMKKNSTGKSSTHNISSVRHRSDKNTLHMLELQEQLKPTWGTHGLWEEGRHHSTICRSWTQVEDAK